MEDNDERPGNDTMHASEENGDSERPTRKKGKVRHEYYEIDIVFQSNLCCSVRFGLNANLTIVHRFAA